MLILGLTGRGGAESAFIRSKYAISSDHSRQDTPSVEACLIFDDFDDVGELPIFVNVQTFDGWLQKLPLLVEGDTVQER